VKTLYRATPALQGGGSYHIPTAQGERGKAIAEAENWIAHNRLNGEVWSVKVEACRYG
jgi:hypothetical protein